MEKDFPSAIHTGTLIRTPFKMPVIHNSYSSDIEIIHKPITMNMRNSLVRLKAKEVDPYEYVDDICNGFYYAYKRTMDHKNDALFQFDLLYDHDSRILLRHSQQYYMYLRTSLFPEFLKDIGNRIQFLYVLEKHKLPKEIFEWEHYSLLHMYIPTFYFNGKGKYLMEGRKKILDHHFKKTSFQCFKEHIQELNDDDLYRQELLIRMALGERDINLFQKKDFLQIRQAEELIPYIQPWIIEHDESIFCSTIEVADYGCSLKRLDRNLYNGIPGLLLALALLSKSNPEITKVYHILERNMFRYTDEMSMDASKKKPKNTGMFVGEGSIVYTYLLLYKILGHIEFLEYAKKHAEIVQSQIACDEAYDLLSGNAGWIVVLSKLFEVTGDSKYIEYAIDTEEQLWKHKVNYDQGIGWICKEQDIALAGMSHGNSGIILAYSYLLKHTGNMDYKEKIIQMIKYEDSLYSESERNWRDMRNTVDPERQSANVWCHGGTGIVLSRLALWKLKYFKDDVNVISDLKNAIDCLNRWEDEDRVCICHGLSGIYQIYKICGRELKDPIYMQKALEVKEKILSLQKYDIHEVACMSLMTGIVGLILVLCDAAEDIIW